MMGFTVINLIMRLFKRGIIVTAHAEKSLREFEAYKAAQKWVEKNPLPSKALLIIRNAVEDLRLRSVRQELLNSGYADLVDAIGKKFSLFQALGGGTGGPLAATMKGLVNKGSPKCIVCGSQLGRLNVTICSSKCRKWHSKEYAGPSISKTRAAMTPEQKAQHQANIASANMAKYGFTTYNQSPEARARAKLREASLSDADRQSRLKKVQEGMLRKYGVANAMLVPHIRDKTANGVRKAYKDRGAEISEKLTRTMMRKYGVKRAIHLEENRNKTFKGERIKLQGNEFFYQGYEHHVLKSLDARGWKLSVSCKGITYKDSLGKERLYFPDIKAQRGDRRLVIEVKSVYTFNWTKANAHTKFYAGTKWAAANGADYIVCIVEPRRNLMRVLVNPTRKSDLKLKLGKIFDL